MFSGPSMYSPPLLLIPCDIIFTADGCECYYPSSHTGFHRPGPGRASAFIAARNPVVTVFHPTASWVRPNEANSFFRFLLILAFYHSIRLSSTLLTQFFSSAPSLW